MQGVIRNSQNGFGKVLTGSLIAHGAVIAIVLFAYRSDAKRVFTPVYNVSLVDPAALSDKTSGKTKASAPQAAPPQKTVEKKAGKKEAALEKTSSKKPRERKETVKPQEPPQKAGLAAMPQVNAQTQSAASEKAHTVDDAITRLKKAVKEREERSIVDAKIDALRKKNEAASVQARKNTGEAKKGTGAPPGNPAADISAGLQASAATGAMAPGRNKAYSNLVAARVQENWIYPAEYKKDKISIIVSIRIGRNGQLLAAWVEESSGSLRFDDSLIDAIKKAAPFPPLPHDVDGDSFELGLRFCPYCK